MLVDIPQRQRRLLDRPLIASAARRARSLLSSSRRTFLEPNWLPRSECRIVPAGLRSAMALRSDRGRRQSSSDKIRLIPLGLTHADMGI